MASGTWRDRPVLAWALYDWANSAFALAVLTAFVPVMLGSHWNDGAPSTVTTFRLGAANSLASFVVVLLAPMLGAMTDQARRRKPWIVLFTALGVVATILLGGVGQGGWPMAMALFVAASVGFFAANSLYDAMLVDVAEPAAFDRVSALGYGLGYLGGALLFTVSLVLLARPQAFGLAGQTAAIRLSFLLVGIWWALFTLPLVFWVRERHATAAPTVGAFRAGLRELVGTLRSLRSQPNLVWFLVAYWLYIDGVYTIIKMAVDYGLSQGLSTTDVTAALLLTNFIGFPAAIGFGVLGERLGTRTGIYIALAVYIIATFLAVFLTTAPQFYGLAVTIGLVQGGVQSLSRSLFARLIPPEKSGEYFGFFNMLGKFSSILGPFLAGTAALLAGSQRIGILSILVLFIAGLVLLARVRVPAAGALPSSAG
ncbi:MAG: MFS transporter [Gammaproteobacteria bacterium PRO9]|nr:MFS transporter [Gammaproteobacteria bacterium PRO9]